MYFFFNKLTDIQFKHGRDSKARRGKEREVGCEVVDPDSRFGVFCYVFERYQDLSDYLTLDLVSFSTGVLRSKTWE